MIARVWRGWVRPGDAQAYADYVEATGMAVSRATPGNHGAYVTSRPDGDRTEILTITFWESREAIAGFAGAHIDQAVFFPEDDRYLIDRETTVRHYTVH